MKRLEGKVAFVTGAAEGIGRAICERFLDEGACVAAIDVKAALVQTVVARAGPGAAVAFECDVTSAEAVRKAVAATVEAFGKIDTVCNVAGGSTPKDGKVTEAPESEFWRTIGVDLFGTFLCCKYGLPEIVRAGGGAVINFASITALMAIPNKSCYAAAKGGVIAMTRQMAGDYGHDGVRVNAIAPGVTLSPRVLVHAESARADALGQRHLLGLLEPPDIAHLAVFLASDEAHRITGQVFTADSGATIM